MIVNKESLQIMGSYMAMEKDDSSANRSYLQAEPLCKHIELPEGVDEKYAVCEMQEGEMVLVESEDKELAHMEQCWDNIRAQRNKLLSESDFSQLEDVPMSAPQKAAWVAYRQALRDLPEEVVDPRQEVEWPVKPE